MKKNIKKLLAVLLCVILCVSTMAIAPACGGDSGDQIDYSTAKVTSNGGTTVVVGNEVYFINGMPDYTDEEGKTNITGNVVKGALYKTTVTSYRKNYDDVLKEEGEDDNADYLYDVLDFADYQKLDYKALGYYTIGSDTEPARVTDENGNSVQNYVPTNQGRSEYRIGSELVISKKIGTSGYADGGFWIFDGIVYFASPDTDKDTEGNVLYEINFISYTAQVTLSVP